MDPITTAIIAAASGGVAQPLVKELYAELMKYIRTNYGKSNLPTTVDMLEETPESDALPGLLREEVARSGADKDTELTQLAVQILNSLKNNPEGQKTLKMVNCKVGIVAGDHTVINGDINL